jgi:hypothetical protein
MKGDDVGTAEDGGEMEKLGLGYDKLSESDPSTFCHPGVVEVNGVRACNVDLAEVTAVPCGIDGEGM